MNKTILIRVDASAEMGAGHLMRMLALGQFLSDAGYEIHFATVPHHPQFSERLKSEGFQVHGLTQASAWNAQEDLRQFLKVASGIQPSWVVLDGHHFDANYELGIKRSSCNLLRIVDVPSRHYYADAILNQNYGAENMTYSVEKDGRVFAGLKYVMLRREFRQAVLSKKQENDKSFHILVTLGNISDKTDKLNLKIIQGFSELEHKNVTVTFIARRMDADAADIKKAAKDVFWPIEIKSRVMNMAEEMTRADLAITSGGSTMWELMYMRVPFLAASLTQAQKDYLPLLAENDLCVNLGWHEDVTPASVAQEVGRLLQDTARRTKIRNRMEHVLSRDGSPDLLQVFEGACVE